MLEYSDIRDLSDIYFKVNSREREKEREDRKKMINGRQKRH